MIGDERDQRAVASRPRPRRGRSPLTRRARCRLRRPRSRGVVVAGSGRERAARAKALLFAASRLAAFAEQVGLGLEQPLLCRRGDRAVHRGQGAPARCRRRHGGRCAPTSGRSRGRSSATRSRRRCRWSASARRRRTRRRRSTGICGWRPRRAPSGGGLRAIALVCLGAGAGIVAGELRARPRQRHRVPRGRGAGDRSAAPRALGAGP